MSFTDSVLSLLTYCDATCLNLVNVKGIAECGGCLSAYKYLMMCCCALKNGLIFCLQGICVCAQWACSLWQPYSHFMRQVHHASSHT